MSSKKILYTKGKEIKAFEAAGGSVGTLCTSLGAANMMELEDDITDGVLARRLGAVTEVQKILANIERGRFHDAEAALQQIAEAAPVLHRWLHTILLNATQKAAKQMFSSIVVGETQLGEILEHTSNQHQLVSAAMAKELVTRCVDAATTDPAVGTMACGAWKSVAWPGKGLDHDEHLGVLRSSLCSKWCSTLEWLAAGGAITPANRSELNASTLSAPPHVDRPLNFLGLGLAAECCSGIVSKFLEFLHCDDEEAGRGLPVGVALAAYGHLTVLLHTAEEIGLGESCSAEIAHAAGHLISNCASDSAEELQCCTIAYKGNNAGFLQRLKGLTRQWGDAVPDPLMVEIFFPAVVDAGLMPLADGLLEDPEKAALYQRKVEELLVRVETLSPVPLPAVATLRNLLTNFC